MAKDSDVVVGRWIPTTLGRKCYLSWEGRAPAASRGTVKAIT